MATSIITTDDLREFKLELLDDIKKLLNAQKGQVPKKWLKSHEVREYLSISPGTLQNLRIKAFYITIIVIFQKLWRKIGFIINFRIKWNQ